MSTTTSGPEIPEARRITSSGKFQCADPLGGVVHPRVHVAVAAPDVGGWVAGTTGGVGFVVGEAVVAGTGLGIDAVGVPSSPPKHAVAAVSGNARQHKKTMNLVTRRTPTGPEALGGYRADG
jgi:hypothetical protein